MQARASLHDSSTEKAPGANELVANTPGFESKIGPGHPDAMFHVGQDCNDSFVAKSKKSGSSQFIGKTLTRPFGSLRQKTETVAQETIMQIVLKS